MSDTYCVDPGFPGHRGGRPGVQVSLVGCAVIVCVLVLQSRTVCSQEERISKSEVLRHVRAAIARYDSVDMKATCRTEFGKSLGGPGIQTTELEVKRHDTRALISRKFVVERPGQSTSCVQSDQIVYDNGDVLNCQAMLNESLEQINERHGLALHSKRLAGSQRLDRSTVYGGLNDSAVVLWFVGYFPLLEYLDRSSDVVVTFGDAGARIMADSELGALTLNVSASSGWLPQSFQIIKRPQHKSVRGVAVAEATANSENRVTSITWSGEAANFIVATNGHSVPTSLHLEREVEYQGEPAETSVTTIQVNELVFDPPLAPSDFETTIRFPEDFPVSVMGAQHLPYKWNGRAPVPGVPAAIPGLVPIESPGHGPARLTILLVANAMLVALCGFVFWWRRKKTSQSHGGRSR